MAVVAPIVAAPPLTSLAGLFQPSLAGAFADSQTLSSHQKRSSNPRLSYMTAQNQFTLHIWPNGTVSGIKYSQTPDRSTTKYALLRLYTTFSALSILARPTSKSDPLHLLNPTKDHQLRIQAEETNMWLCMSSNGALYGSSSKTDECLFSTERINKFYYIYRTFHNSQKNSNTKKYIALNRKGKTRKHVLKMHRSARFNVTQNLEPPIKLLPPERYQLLKPKPSKKGRKDIRLRSGLKSGSKFYKRPGTTTSNNKKSRRRQKKKQRLSQILKSIELSLRRPTSASHANFADSLLLDYGGVNPFTNSATGDAIRHSSNKIYKSKNPKRTYKRKSSSSEG